MSVDVVVGLVSGRTATVQAALDETVGTLKRRAQNALGVAAGLIWMFPGWMCADQEGQGAEW